ncbi:unnamed protein product [Brachionus calyciflorus]|uniref:Uncharacterized protein n=1 Tax=Brachionus calyciflorus TaxID=104777 RepID=A0A814PPD2_9BILA|nr:unnamed protein product [Brachionus calyciflorus]
MQNQYQNKIEIEDLKKEVNKINSILSLIINPNKNQSVAVYNPNRPYSKHDNILLDLDSYFKLSILKLIDDEQLSRDQRKSKIVIIGLSKTDNDQRTINRLFKSLNQPLPISFERLKSRRPEGEFPGPVICELINVFHVEKILKESYKLKSFDEFKNVYKYGEDKYSTKNKISEPNFSQNLNKSTAVHGKQDQCASAKLPNSNFDQNKAQIDSNKSDFLDKSFKRLSNQDFKCLKLNQKRHSLQNQSSKNFKTT